MSYSLTVSLPWPKTQTYGINPITCAVTPEPNCSTGPLLRIFIFTCASSMPSFLADLPPRQPCTSPSPPSSNSKPCPLSSSPPTSHRRPLSLLSPSTSSGILRLLHESSGILCLLCELHCGHNSPSSGRESLHPLLFTSFLL